MMFRRTLFAAAIASASIASALAAITAEEAKQLGTTLTPVGAEKAGNKDGTIPEWTGGYTTIPAGFVKGSGMRPDPFAADKPRLTITGKNADEHKDKLTVGTYTLLKKYPSYRIDVYPTRRSQTMPKRLLDNSIKNATVAKTTSGGEGIADAIPGVPFPIPKTGHEAIWNHLVRYIGNPVSKFQSNNVDSAGVITLAAQGDSFQEFPIYSSGKNDVFKGTDIYYQIKVFYTAPARRAGEALIVKDAVNPLEQGRRAWQYLPGQRRVKLAPDISYDTPNPGVAGLATYDDTFIFNGALDRFDWKLVGKKEMYVPYNAYKFYYYTGEVDGMAKANHINPDLERWELHRVWVVEATLKPDKRHIYHKRTFYLDEDSWINLASDQYDARGQLYRSGIAYMSWSYDALAPTGGLNVFFDFIAGAYSIQGHTGRTGGTKYVDSFPDKDWQPDVLAGAGIR